MDIYGFNATVLPQIWIDMDGGLGKVMDTTRLFMEVHPGGVQLMDSYMGKNILSCQNF